MWNVTQSGNNVTVRSGGITLNGTIAGNTLSLQGSYFEDGGTTTVTGANITIGVSGDSLSGPSVWTWSDGFETCSGSTTLGGSRQ